MTRLFSMDHAVAFMAGGLAFITAMMIARSFRRWRRIRARRIANRRWLSKRLVLENLALEHRRAKLGRNPATAQSDLPDDFWKSGPGNTRIPNDN
jgi:hypothetical protein